MKKSYDFLLPVFKRGDDLLHYLDMNQGNISAGFKGLAEQYIQAAEMCSVISKVLESSTDVEVFADNHWISIQTENKELIKPLLDQGILVEDDFHDMLEEEFEDLN
jgi:hypothetical protein